MNVFGNFFSGNNFLFPNRDAPLRILKKIEFHNVNKISQSLQKSCHYLSCIIR